MGLHRDALALGLSAESQLGARRERRYAIHQKDADQRHPSFGHARRGSSSQYRI
jgi:hypothetical protein